LIDQATAREEAAYKRGDLANAFGHTTIRRAIENLALSCERLTNGCNAVYYCRRTSPLFLSLGHESALAALTLRRSGVGNYLAENT
jgi:hypothetical protein